MATAPLEAPAPTKVIDDHEHYEVVGDVRVETPRMGTYETDVANNLMGSLDNFVRGNGLGKALVEMLFRIDVDEDLQRRPDLAVVTYARWPKGRPPSPNDTWNVVPDLAVEVVSPSTTVVTRVEAW